MAVQIWLAMDPQTRRVMAQDREWTAADFPRGPRGLDWPRRTLDVDSDQFARLLAGGLPADEADTIHRDWWNEAGGEGAPSWPAA